MSELRFYEGRKPKDTFMVVSRWVVDIIAVVVLSVVLFYWFGTTVRIVEKTMEPTISSESNALLDRISYSINPPGRFDIIAFNSDNETFIRRIIGLPGETVQIIDGEIYIDGEVLKLEWTDDIIQYAGLAAKPLTLGYDEYFVMGDNVNGSDDSRRETFGNVRESEIIGRIWHRGIW